jgi:MFS family permease
VQPKPQMRARYFALLSLLWLPMALFWAGAMTQILPERVEHFVRQKTVLQMHRPDMQEAAQKEAVEIRVTKTKGRYLALIGGLGALVSTLIQLLIGPLSDNTTHRKGRRYPYIFWGVLLNTIPLLAFGLSRSFAQLVIAFVLIQLLMNVAMGPFQALIPDLVPPDHQGRASGFLGFWQLTGQVAGLVLAGLLLDRIIVNRLFPTTPLRTPAEAASFGVLVFCSLCAALLLLLLAVYRHSVRERPPSEAANVPMRVALRELFHLGLKPYPDFTRLLYSRFVINLGIYTGIEFLRYYVQECLPMQGRSISLETMWVTLAATFGGVLGTFQAGALADRISKRTVIYFTCAVAAASAVLFCLNHAVWGARVIGFIFGAGYGAFCAVDWAFATNLMPRGQEGKYMAIFHIAFTVPQVLVLVFGGLLADAVAMHYGGNTAYRAVFWTIPCYLAIGTALISKVRERHEIEKASVGGGVPVPQPE